MQADWIQKIPFTSLYLGICYKEMGKYDSAIVHLESLIKFLFPSYTSDVFTHLGASYELSKIFSDATYSYTKAGQPHLKIHYFIAIFMIEGSFHPFAFLAKFIRLFINNHS